MKMKITQYGYKNDPYMDSYTARGEGAYHQLQVGVSCALTDSAKAALGAHHGSWVRIHFAGGSDEVRRYDDRAPEHDMRVDLYNPGGFVNGLSDYAEVSLTTDPTHHGHDATSHRHR
jgi:hypothetical protein